MTSIAMEKTPNWLEMPHEIMGGMILQRLGAVEILNSAQKVCTTWRRICKDPAMWKVIELDHYFDFWYEEDDFEELSKQAVHRSCGELIDISLKYFGTDDLLDFISQCSSKLNSLRLTKCYSITGNGLIHALKRLPRLETLDLFYVSIDAEDIRVIGRSCPQLKSFKMKTRFMECDGDALAIANSMSALRHLQMFGSTMTDDGLQAILNGCPHLESLDVRRCFCVKLGGNLEKLCKERIKDFKFTPPPSNPLDDCGFSPGVYAHEDYEFSDSDSDEFYGDYDFIGGNAISSEDDFDNHSL
ncbi:hypothetical protein L6452_35756 [Arctium lappa]|uniref:Uncharacterized protein n=1 Tax=Arctium lappa TaxID=4217 RepID=A0ACB8Y820_ARCLA|nr:hypothetical protein L6452_35756 [Arctium lappa]